VKIVNLTYYGWMTFSFYSRQRIFSQIKGTNRCLRFCFIFNFLLEEGPNQIKDQNEVKFG